MKFPVPLIAILAAVAPAAHAVTFYTPVSITSSTSGTDLFSATNLIQGPGIGYSAAEPHDALGPGGDPGYSWVTSAPGGFPSDYIAVAGQPILVLDLGATLPLSEISTWGYNNGNANGVSAFSLRFSTTGTFSGGPVESFTAAISSTTRDSHPFTSGIQLARFVEFTVTDNYFSGGGFGPPPGGDRVGLGEISFQAIPEPSTALLSAAALLGLARRRRS